MKEIEEDTNRWIEDTNHVLGLEEAVLLKWPYYPSQSIDSMQSLSNYQWHFFIELEQKILQFVWRHKRPQIVKAMLKKKKGAGGLRLLTSDYTTKLQSSKQYGNGIKTEIEINGTV